MTLRRDALAGAAECVVMVEALCTNDEALFGTVGQIEVRPGATNVIPGLATFSVDVRSASNDKRKKAVGDQHSNGMRALGFLRECIARGIKAKKLRKMDPDVAARAAWAAMHGITSLLITQKEFPWGDHERVIDGDARSAAIAAASVIAKVTRDRYMRRVAAHYPEWAFEGNVGYSTPEHREAIIRHGICALHRRSFASVAYSQLGLDGLPVEDESEGLADVIDIRDAIRAEADADDVEAVAGDA